MKSNSIFWVCAGMKSCAVTFQSKILYQHFHMVLFTTQQALTLDSVQRAKKVVSGSPGLVDIAIALVNSVLNLPDGQVKWTFKEFKLHKNCVINPAYQIEKVFGASWNEFWASTGQLKFARMASCKTDFPYTLLWLTRTFRLTVACVPDQRIYIRLFCSLSSIARFSDITLQSEI